MKKTDTRDRWSDSSAAVDYEALLRRYMSYVRMAEGVDFVSENDHHRSEFDFTQTEWDALLQASEDEFEGVVPRSGHE